MSWWISIWAQEVRHCPSSVWVGVLEIQQDFCDVIHPVPKGREGTHDTDRGRGASALKQTPAKGPKGLHEFDSAHRDWASIMCQAKLLEMEKEKSSRNHRGDRSTQRGWMFRGKHKTARYTRKWFKPQTFQRNVTSERKGQLKGRPWTLNKNLQTFWVY